MSNNNIITTYTFLDLKKKKICEYTIGKKKLSYAYIKQLELLKRASPVCSTGHSDSDGKYYGAPRITRENREKKRGRRLYISDAFFLFCIIRELRIMGTQDGPEMIQSHSSWCPLLILFWNSRFILPKSGSKFGLTG